MALYAISNRVGGSYLGLYAGTSEEDAINTMDIDAGHTSTEAAAEVLGLPVETLRSELIVEEITDEAVADLRDEAMAAGDLSLADTCRAALAGSEDARRACADVMREARSQG